MKNAVKLFNSLDGKKVSRQSLVNLKELAVDQDQRPIVERLVNLLESDPVTETFIIQLTSKIKEVLPGHTTKNKGLGCPDEDCTCGTDELSGLEHLPETIDMGEGLGKAVTPDDIYQYVTDLIINTINKEGLLPWQKGFENSGLSDGKEATNYESKKGYRGINFMLLNFEVKWEDGEPYLAMKNWDNPFFLTFNQIKKFKGQLKKGSHGHRVVYFTRLYGHSENKDDGSKLEFYTYDQKKFRAWIEKNRSKLKILKRGGWTVERLAKSYIPILKYYNVFNAGDITGIDWDKIPVNPNADKSEKDKIVVAEKIVANYPNPPKIVFRGDQPMYMPKDDTVYQTPLAQWEKPQQYYSVLFHELIHSTGAQKRLARKFGRKGTPDYAKEELIAEMGAVFLCAESGILFETLDNSAAYLKGWNSRLVSNMKKDNRFFFRASSKAQEASDHILSPDKNGEPKYRKSKGLAAPRHTGVEKDGLNDCGRLKKGYMYEKGGKIVKVEKKSRSATNKKDVAVRSNKKKGADRNTKNKDTAEKSKGLTRAQFEEGLARLKFEIVEAKNDYYKSPQDFKRDYNLNYEDIGGVELSLFTEHDKSGKLDALHYEFRGIGRKDKSYTYTEGMPIGEVYRDLLEYLAHKYEMTISEAVKLKEQYGDTLYRKKDKNQLGLFGSATINVSSDHFKNMKVSELRKFTLDYYNRFLNGRTVAIEKSIQKLEFVKKSGGKISKGGAMYKEKAAVIERFEEIVKNSTYNNWGERKPTDKKDVLGYLNFKSKLVIDGKKRHVRIVVVVYKNRSTFLKDYNLDQQKTAKTSEGAGGHSSNGEGKAVSKVKDTKNVPKKKKGLGTPIVLDGGEPYPHPSAPERTADNGDAAVSVSDFEVVAPLVVRPRPGVATPKNKVSASTGKKSGLVTKISNVGNSEAQSYRTTGDLGRFLGEVEIKPSESVVTTLDAPQGAMKTRLFFQLMNMYGANGYRVLFYSGEEHKDSVLFAKKRDQYLGETAQDNIDTVSDLPNGVKDFYGLVPDYDIIFVDSWGKLTKKDKAVDLDDDVRKRFDGKHFFIIYQRTTTGSMRGGSNSQFDGDQIMKIHKSDDGYEHNYAYWDKNRYEQEPNLKYNIFNQRIQIEEPEVASFNGQSVVMI